MMTQNDDSNGDPVRPFPPAALQLHMPTQAAMGQPWNISPWLPACQILARYDVNSALALHRGFLGFPTPHFLLSYCDLFVFPGDSRPDQRDLEPIYENKISGVSGDHSSNGLPIGAGVRPWGRVSEKPCSHAPESLHGDSSRVTGKQLTYDQDVSVFPSSAPAFSPAVAVAISW